MARKKVSADMQTPSEKYLVVKGNIDLTVPSYLKETGRGKEHISPEDLVLPRIKLTQPLSPEVMSEKCKPGQYINALTGEVYGDKINIIAIKHFKSRMYWKDRQDGGGILCSSPDAINPLTTHFNSKCSACELKDWHDEAKRDVDKQPKCALYYNFAIIVEGDIVPAALAMEKTKIKVAKKLLSLAAYTGTNLDMFAKKYTLGVAKEHNDKGEWYNYTVTPMGFVSESEYKLAEQTFINLKDIVIKVEVDNDPDQEDASNDFKA